MLSDPSVIRFSKYYLDSFKDGIPQANNCKTQYRNDNFFYVPIAIVMVLLDIYTTPLFGSAKTKFSDNCHHTQNAISLGIFW